MKKIAEITYLGAARNAEHYDLQNSLLNAITAGFATKFGISELRVKYEDLFRKEDNAYLQTQAFADTRMIDEKDALRDQRFRLIDLTVQSKLLGLTPAEQEAAQKIAFAMKVYANAPNRPFAENTAMVDDMVQKLQTDEYAPAIKTLGLTEAVAALKTANDDFKLVFSHRADEKLVRATTDTLKMVRPEVDAAFLALSEAINAIYFVAETIEKSSTKAAELGAVIDAANAVILQFSGTLSRRGAGKKITVSPSDPSKPSKPDENPDDL